MHYNNRANTIDISDRGLAYGDGLFETIAVIQGQLQHWQLHWQRLSMGAERLALALPVENEVLLRIQQLLIEHHSSLNAVIKIILTRGSGGRGYLFPENQCENLIISYHQWPERSADDYVRGIDAIVCKTTLAKQPALSGIKHLNRLEQVLARNEFDQQKYQEGIMLSHSQQGNSWLIEGCSSNLFFVLNSTLCTPKITDCGVLGTMRQSIIDFGRQHSAFHVQQSNYDIHLLEQATEVFFTNSIYGILPVASISFAAQQWFYKDKTFTRSLAEQFNKQLQRPFELL
ncbi:MAG: aminodeoxychorismate lyase [Thiotrichaceae bacterium]|nr:aminodeoxychorismate lyase [Thiotrichaceae bacterium]